MVKVWSMTKPLRPPPDPLETLGAPPLIGVPQECPRSALILATRGLNVKILEKANMG